MSIPASSAIKANGSIWTTKGDNRIYRIFHDDPINLPPTDGIEKILESSSNIEGRKRLIHHDHKIYNPRWKHIFLHALLTGLGSAYIRRN